VTLFASTSTNKLVMQGFVLAGVDDGKTDLMVNLDKAVAGKQA
jgi:hypothetical protein